MTKIECEVCHQKKHTRTALVRGKYYANICDDCIGGTNMSSGSAGFDRRRGYEDNAQDTVQPYNAAGQPNPEFYRLYPARAEKIFTKDEIEQVKQKI